MYVDRLEVQHPHHTKSRSHHGDFAVAGIRNGVGTCHRSDQCVWPDSQDVEKKQARNQTATRCVTSSCGTSLTVDLLAKGYAKNPCDKCLFTLFSNEDTSEGQVLQMLMISTKAARNLTTRPWRGFTPSTIVAYPLILRNKLRPIEVPKGYLSNAVPRNITIWPLLYVELRWTTFTSGFDTGERQRHQ